MNHTRLLQTTTLTKVLLATCLFWSPLAQAADLPPVQQYGDITYLEGGIGGDEAAAIQEQRANYNLYVMSADTLGEFTGDIALTINNAAGQQVLSIMGGPLVYVQLPPGRYNITGELNGERRDQKIFLSGSNAAHVHFSWAPDQVGVTNPPPPMPSEPAPHAGQPKGKRPLPVTIEKF